jgi:hypothetical protein
MAKKTTSTEDAFAKGGSLNNDAFGIGELDDGSFNTFPASELGARTAERDAQEAALDDALDEVFDDPFLDDDSDLELDDEEDDSGD